MLQERTITYFAYGSNLSPDQMLRRCPASRLTGVAQLPGWRLAFGGHSLRWGGATASLVKARGNVVEGLLYTMPLKDLLLLDRFEGHPAVYRRRRVHVRDSAGCIRHAQAYVLPLERESHPAPDYLDQMWDSYVSMGLGVDGLLAALGRGRSRW